jgi:hypothetical protein
MGEKMNELFRILRLRKFEALAAVDSISLEKDTELQRSLIEARNKGASFEDVKEIARKFQGKKDEFVTDALALTHGIKLADLQFRIGSGKGLDLSKLETSIQKAFNAPAKTVINSPEFQKDKTRLYDSLIVAYLLALEVDVKVNDLVTMARLMAIVERVANADTKLSSEAAILQALRMLISLPGNIFLPLKPLVPGLPSETKEKIEKQGGSAKEQLPQLGSPTKTEKQLKQSMVKPLGIGDLIAVKHHILRYELGEVSHIEGLLKGERATHYNRTIEASKTISSEEDERNDLKSAVTNVIAAEALRKPGILNSPAYGILADSSPTNSFAQEVTNQATNVISSRLNVRSLHRLAREAEVKAERVFDNSQGKENVIGVYQRLDKIYLAQEFNYGKRLLYDVTIPEPAAFLLFQAFEEPQNKRIKLSEPPAFTHSSPKEINEENWMDLAQRFSVKDVGPPPPEFVTISQTVSFQAVTSSEDKTTKKTAVLGTKTIDVDIPNGYSAFRFLSIAAIDRAEDAGEDARKNITVCVSNERQILDSGLFLDLPLDEKEGRVPVTILVVYDHVQAVTVAIEIRCKRTDSLFQAWQLKTHNAIVEARLRLQAEYEEYIADQEAVLRVKLFNRPPELKREIERLELKRLFISALTGQEFDIFDIALVLDMWRITPVADALGNFIRFFEQAFEWEHMMYFFYPYYWGIKKLWARRTLMSDSDPQFEAFLKAGAARLVVPVRLGFEAALDYFMNTGNIPPNEEMKDINSPFFVSIAEEIRNQEGAPDNEVPRGESWEVRVPSRLIKLHHDGHLPKWSFEKGKWIMRHDENIVP